MKQRLKIYGLSLLSLALLACEERTPDLYSAPDALYFNNRTVGNAPVDTMSTTFVYQPDTVMHIDIPVVVQSAGRQAAFDRPVDIRVYSENALEGEDYELITPAVMPANTSQFIYYVRVKRTASLASEIKYVYLELRENEYFETFLEKTATGNSAYPYVDLQHYRIAYSDFFTVAPEGWRSEYVGAFSERKLRLLWKLYPHIPREDYYVRGAIPFNQWTYMAKNIGEYMYEQAAILAGYATGVLDLDVLVDPDAPEDQRQLLDFTPVRS